MTTHYLLFNAAITDKNVQTFISWTAAKIIEGATDFVVAISTGGGSVNAGILMSNYIRSIPQKVAMHNVSTVGSIGIPIFCAAGTRYSNRLASFVFHGSGLTPSKRLDQASLRQLLDSVSGQNEIIAQAIHTTSGLDMDTCRTLLVGETTKSSDWAASNKICHEIRDFSLPKGANLINLFDA